MGEAAGPLWPRAPDNDQSPDFVRLDMLPQNAPPAVAAQGTLYFDNGTTTNNFDPKLRAYNGAAWSDFVMTSDATLEAEDLELGAAITLATLSTAPTGVTGKVYNDNGDNRADSIAEPTLRYYNGSTYLDIPGVSSGGDAGVSAMTLTPSMSGSYDMAVANSYIWYQIGALFIMKAFVQWSNSTSPMGDLSIPNFLPVNAVTSLNPSQFGVSIDSYSGINMTSAEYPAARISDGSRHLTLLAKTPHTGGGMITMNESHVNSAGIIYMTVTMIVSQRA